MKLKLLYLAETLFLFLLAYALVYAVIIILAKFGLFEISHNLSSAWRLNPAFAFPHLIAISLGMVGLPLVWERGLHKTTLNTVGFTIPLHFAKEMGYAILVLISFFLYIRCCLSMKISCPVFLFSDLLSIGLGWFLIVLGEEVLYRGIIQRRLSVVFGKYTGWLLASAIFAFIGHPQSSLIDNIILRLPFGLILGYLYFRSQSLLFPIVLHWVYNCLFAL